MITLTQFRAATGSSPVAAARHMAAAVGAMQMFGITSKLAIAAFLANMGHETLNLIYMQELWGPTEAQRRYEPPSTLATKLGNNRLGDGRRYMGCGPTQLTGRANYRRATVDLRAKFPALGVPDFEAAPDKAAEPQWGWLIASQFFSSRGCTAKAEAGDFDGVCRTINGGTNGLDDRRTRYAKALAALA